MMDRSYIIRLQKAVGSSPDGVIGQGTLTAMFRKLGASQARADALGLAANVYFRDSGILDHPLILAHFMGQAIKETGSFVYLEEIASGKAYEGRVDLGNTIPGYGVLYKGRGIFQLTGYANYVLYSKKIGIDLVTNPKRAAEADISLIVACRYWTDKGLTALALKDDIEAITRKVNGGLNGFAERKIAVDKMKKWLGV